MHKESSLNLNQLAHDIKSWSKALGFQQVGITDTDLSAYEKKLDEWLAKQYHGKMDYMQRHGHKRTRPAELVPGTQRIISVRMDYLPPNSGIQEALGKPDRAYISRYAVGRDYHTLIRKRLEKLARKITTAIGPFGYRAFCDSAPVMEKPIAEKAGLGWIGKHTVLINRQAGSWFFLGELYTDLPLQVDTPETSHCGSCQACLTICPTQAIVAPYQLDARRCISYLTIELRESIPEDLRPLIGNRVYGCDDCQIICPWNRFAKPTEEQDFHPRQKLNAIDLITLFHWSKQEFLRKTEGSAIRRIGYECWLRNLAVGLGNAPTSTDVIAALKSRLEYPSELVREHVIWALKRHSRL